MFTAATTPRFEKDAAQIWSESEIDDLITSVSDDPHQGDLIPGTGGLRKLRWARKGTGKRGGCKGNHLRNRPARIGLAVDCLYESSVGQHERGGAGQIEKGTPR